MRLIQVLVVITTALQCHGVTYSEQLEHITRRRLENLGLFKMAQSKLLVLPMRRLNPSRRRESVILGAPSMASHLPEAEPIMPAHTLIRPAIGMLKSAVKFPHKDNDNGGGVYGNFDNIGIKYDGRNERVMYSGFRRMPSNYIMVAPIKSRPNQKLRFHLSPVKLLQDEEYERYKLLENQEKMKPKKERVYVAMPSASSKDAIILKQLSSIFSQQHKAENAQKITKTARNEAENVVETTFKIEEATVKESKESVFNMIKEVSSFESMKHDKVEQGKGILRNMDSSSIEEDLKTLDKLFKEDNNDSPSSSAEKKAKKLDWFWQSKNAFNHVKINMNAPDHTELLPDTSSRELRNWWFFHQDDFTPFKE